MTNEHLRRMIDDALEGTISEADFIALEAELSVNASARREYLERVELSTLLAAEAEESDTPVQPQRPSRSSTAVGFVTAAIAVAISLIAIVVSQRPEPVVTARETAETEATGYGVIRGQDEAVWSDGMERANGTLLPTGRMQLDAGLVQIELFSGVSLVMEAPASFSVASAMNLVVERGKVRAHVPEPAHGFRVSTEQGDVVDLGTDFAVEVANQRAELHVLEGEVELHGKRRNTRRRVTTGQALVLSDANHEAKAADRDKFVGQDEIAGRYLQKQDARRKDWLAYRQRLCQDPRVVAYYQFAAPRKLANTSNAPNGIAPPSTWYGERRINNLAAGGGASEAALVGAVRTTDRWQVSDGGLDFSPMGSRVRLTVPGEHRSISLLCWVKINSLDRWYNSLFLTDGHEQSEPHWQIMDDGRLFFSVKKRDQWDASRGEKDKHIYYSPPFWNTSLSGQWLMIATVYDVDRRKVTHYVNGNAISEEPIPDEYFVETVRIGNASLCNWSSPERDEPKFAVRNLNGSLDEFALFSGVVSAEEMKEIYEYGKP